MNLSGYLKIKSRSYVFHYENKLLTLTPGQQYYKKMIYQVISNEPLSYEVLFGITNHGLQVSFLKCIFRSDGATLIAKPAAVVKEQNIYSSKIDIRRIDAISFRGNRINAFYPPHQLLKSCDYEEHFKGIPFKPSDEYTRYHKVRLKGEEITICLSIGTPSLSYVNTGKSPLGDISSFLRIQFEKPKRIEKIAFYYDAIYKLISFSCNRKNVGFEEIQLHYKDEGGLYDNLASLYVNSAANDSETPAHKTLDYSLLNDQVEQILRWSFRQELRFYHLPSDDYDARRVEPSSFLRVASTLEDTFEMAYPQKLSNDNKVFVETKKWLSDVIDQKKKLLKQDGHPQTDIQTLDRLKQCISNQENTLREKLEFLYVGYKDILGAIRSRMLHFYKLDDETKDSEIITAYKKLRDKFAHGTLTAIDDKAIIGHVIAQCLIYALQLRMMKMPDDKIKKVVEKLFL